MLQDLPTSMCVNNCQMYAFPNEHCITYFAMRINQLYSVNIIRHKFLPILHCALFCQPILIENLFLSTFSFEHI